MNKKDKLYYSTIALLLVSILFSLFYPFETAQPILGILGSLVFAIVFFKTEIYRFLTKVGMHDDTNNC